MINIHTCSCRALVSGAWFKAANAYTIYIHACTNVEWNIKDYNMDNDNKILVRETQEQDSPATLSKNLIERLHWVFAATDSYIHHDQGLRPSHQITTS